MSETKPLSDEELAEIKRRSAIRSCVCRREFIDPLIAEVERLGRLCWIRGHVLDQVENMDLIGDWSDYMTRAEQAYDRFMRSKPKQNSKLC